MDGGRSRIVGDWSRGCFDMGNQVWTVVLTGFRQMHLKTHPTGRALLAVVGVQIIRRADILCCRRNVLR